MKKEVRVIGWDDCRFARDMEKVRLVGAIFRGGLYIDGMLSVEIERDGMDATENIAASVIRSRHYGQLSIIMLDGISFAGFNLVDIKELSSETGLPVIVAQRSMPDIGRFTAAQRIFKDCAKRCKAVESAGEVYKWEKLYFQKAGLSAKECEEIFALTCVRSNIPEPLRVAHIIASGFGGESRGRA